MATAFTASPKISVHLYKTISRDSVDGSTSVSKRYQGKDEVIDLTPFLNLGSSVRTSKSVREPAGGFNIMFADKPQEQGGGLGYLESIYGLVEPMDLIEIRMWGGRGNAPQKLPIVMRGFVSQVQRGQAMGDNGQPQRNVTVSGQDYGKIWQMYQIIYLAAYAEGKGLLTNFGLWELFGVKADNTMKSGDFVRQVIEKIINPHLDAFMPKNTAMPRTLTLGDGISVKHGVINNSYQSSQGAIYDMLKLHGDVGVWNELYTEDRGDGVHVVYRPVPTLHLTKPKDAKTRLIQDDAPEPIYCPIEDSLIRSLSVARSDASVANFYWVNNTRYDLIDDMQRKLASIPQDDGKVSLKNYPNADPRLYGTRPMYAETQQSDDGVTNMGSGQSAAEIAANGVKMESWIDRRRRHMVEMNRDNVLFESGNATIKGGIMRPDGSELMKAGDYARFKQGRFEWDAYVVQIEHSFQPFQSYTQSVMFERGEGFAKRMAEGKSPWLLELSSRGS